MPDLVGHDEYNKALQRRGTRVSEVSIRNRSSDAARPERSEWSVCPHGAVDESRLGVEMIPSGIIWWDHNWRKGGLQERRLQIIKEYDFYNQLYCGCEFSIRKED